MKKKTPTIENDRACEIFKYVGTDVWNNSAVFSILFRIYTFTESFQILIQTYKNFKIYLWNISFSIVKRIFNFK